MKHSLKLMNNMFLRIARERRGGKWRDGKRDRGAEGGNLSCFHSL